MWLFSVSFVLLLGQVDVKRGKCEHVACLGRERGSHNIFIVETCEEMRKNDKTGINVSSGVKRQR